MSTSRTALAGDVKVSTRVSYLRRRAKQRGERLIQRGHMIEIRDAAGITVARGRCADIEAYFAANNRVHRGPAPKGVPAPWAPLIEDYVHLLRSIGRSPATVTLRGSQLDQLAREIGTPPVAVTEDDLTVWFSRHSDWKPETRRSFRSAVVKFFAWAYKTGRIAADPAAELLPVKQPKAMPRPAHDHAWRTALAAANPRVAVMLRLAAEAGLRRAEVAQVHTRDLAEAIGGAQLVVHGKGGKPRLVPVSESLADAIRAGAAGHTPGAAAAGWLFPDGSGGHLCPAYVGTLVSELLPDNLTMHTLRHRFATRAYRGTRNLRAVQQLLGHASIATTERYVAVDDDEIRAAMMAAFGE